MCVSSLLIKVKVLDVSFSHSLLLLDIRPPFRNNLVRRRCQQHSSAHHFGNAHLMIWPCIFYKEQITPYLDWTEACVRMEPCLPELLLNHHLRISLNWQPIVEDSDRSSHLLNHHG